MYVLHFSKLFCPTAMSFICFLFTPLCSRLEFLSKILLLAVLFNFLCCCTQHVLVEKHTKKRNKAKKFYQLKLYWSTTFRMKPKQTKNDLIFNPKLMIKQVFFLYSREESLWKMSLISWAKHFHRTKKLLLVFWKRSKSAWKDFSSKYFSNLLSTKVKMLSHATKLNSKSWKSFYDVVSQVVFMLMFTLKFKSFGKIFNRNIHPQHVNSSLSSFDFKYTEE